MSQGALYLCHLNTKAGAVVSINQGCPGVHCPVAALVGWQGLLWSRGPWITEVAGQLGHPDCIPVQDGRGLSPLPLQRFLAAPSPLVEF